MDRVYTEGVCDDGAAILRNGVMMPITEILERLNASEALLLRAADHIENKHNIAPIKWAVRGLDIILEIKELTKEN